MCKCNSRADSTTYDEEEKTAREGSHHSIRTSAYLQPDPENLLLVSKRKQRHIRDDCLVKQILIQNIVKELKMELNRKYVCDFSFSALGFSSLCCCEIK